MSSKDNSGKSFRVKSAKLKSTSGSSLALSAKRLVSISGLLLSPVVEVLDHFPAIISLLVSTCLQVSKQQRC